MPMTAPMMAPITESTIELNKDHAKMAIIAAPLKKQTIVQIILIMVFMLTDAALFSQKTAI
mgnify:CR=1 FL=1|tara:strand:- start:80 stop:262 length:183 start_codon:yes stop_codon:yes gene_type:complete